MQDPILTPADLRALRRDAQLTQQQLGEMADIDRDTIGHYERATQPMSRVAQIALRWILNNLDATTPQH